MIAVYPFLKFDFADGSQPGIKWVAAQQHPYDEMRPGFMFEAKAGTTRLLDGRRSLCHRRRIPARRYLCLSYAALPNGESQARTMRPKVSEDLRHDMPSF